ncbi:type VII secretion protein EccB [Mycobacterium xenopi]|uniref:type VII secretion protein EccB n=1 Tax=Mycobacterium xenopi TaxID=1789 RepID=UPI000A168FDD|nr:type VII secretion protein EccB [Mycobacterium xenopi]ORX14145.1 type VII secretion protein EccB [Mycobacterium xenopi]SPX94850.1 type VII secretion protein EccB, Actinobacterial [Mycobacterium xenopi]
MSAPIRERRGFKSRSANLGPTTARSRPWGFVTRHQVSGWRFLIRRISNGVALRDTRMLTDPLRRQGRALSVGVLLGVVLLGGAFVLSVLKPAGLTGNRPVLAERSTDALYVVVNNELHPVLNLASARLIVGKPAEPAVVKAKEIDKFPLGNTLGIPNAPSRMVQSGAHDARWMVCEAVGGPNAGTTVIFGDPVGGPGHAAPLPGSSAILASSDGGKTTWLIWGGKRSQIDLHNAAVTAAVGINVDTPAPRPINRALLNLIPESAPLVVPFVGNAGDPPRFVWPVPGQQAPPIAAVVVDRGENNQARYYAVAADGLQPISPVVAAILRANDAYGLVEPPLLTPDQVAKAPKAAVISVDDYPPAPLRVVDPSTDPVTCGQWVKLDGAPTSSLTLLSGPSLPIAHDANPVTLAAAGPATAQRVILPRGAGYFVQVTGQQPRSATKESLFWVSDLGVRYGIEADPNSHTSPAEALGMTSQPLPIPWAVLSLFSPGPTLSKADALVAH